MPITNVKAVWSGGKLQFVDEDTVTVIAEFDPTGLDPRARIKDTKSADYDLDAQDVGKIIVVLLMFIGITLFTLAVLMGSDSELGAKFEAWGDFLKNVILT